MWALVKRSAGGDSSGWALFLSMGLPELNIAFRATYADSRSGTRLKSESLKYCCLVLVGP